MAPAAPIRFLDETDSTNAEARRRAEEGETGPLWIAARRQSAGRGRRGRVWETGDGNLAATHLDRTERPAAEAAQVSFVAALAVHDLICAFAPAAAPRLKWPNDTLIAGRKVSGALVESGPHPLGGLWVATGIGVNLARAPAEALYPATALADHMPGPPPAPQGALEVLAAAFARWEAIWRTNGFPPIAEAWTARAHGLGEACTARLGAETVEGVAEGLESDGALRLRTAAGVRRISAGDVFF